MALLYMADPDMGAHWRNVLAGMMPELDVRLFPDVGNPADIRWVVAWDFRPDFISTLPNLEIIFSTGAGADQFDFSHIPAGIDVVRMIEPGIVEGMVEYAVMGVLALHRDLPAYLGQQRQHLWHPISTRPAAARNIGVMGLGSLGQAVLERLAGFGFPLAGWSRSSRDLPGVETFAGPDHLPAFLERTDILVCLLPLTPETRGIINSRLLGMLRPGASVLNVGRGGHLVADDLVAALDSGALSAAMLDVTEPEPLPQDHPLWSHPRILLTPHIASQTRPETAVLSLSENLRRQAAGEALTGLVTRNRGY